jgi:hypothetical protein
MNKQTPEGLIIYKMDFFTVQIRFFRPKIMSTGLSVLSVRNEDFKHCKSS